VVTHAVIGGNFNTRVDYHNVVKMRIEKMTFMGNFNARVDYNSENMDYWHMQKQFVKRGRIDSISEANYVNQWNTFTNGFPEWKKNATGDQIGWKGFFWGGLFEKFWFAVAKKNVCSIVYLCKFKFGPRSVSTVNFKGGTCLCCLPPSPAIPFANRKINLEDPLGSVFSITI